MTLFVTLPPFILINSSTSLRDRLGNVPVITKVKLVNEVEAGVRTEFSMVNPNISNSSIRILLFSILKYCWIEVAILGPIPSIFIRSSNEASVNCCRLSKHCERISAISDPTCSIPSPNITLSKGLVLLVSIFNINFDAKISPIRSNVLKSSSFSLYISLIC